MVKRRDTAQLIAEASKLLNSESDAQKYAGLSFLNAVASAPKGPLRKEAFDLIADFILTASDVKITNKVRMRAIHYADDLVGNSPDNFEINEFIQISSLYNRQDILESIEIKNLYAVYIGAIHYADDLVGNNPDNFEINEFIQISSLHNRKDTLKSIEIKNLY